jgi:metal-responsive CopG/Arc/MetJ family transcriptional regulator
MDVYMRARYVNISLPEELIKKLDGYIEKSREGYHSRPEFIGEAIRLRMGLLKEKSKEK